MRYPPTKTDDHTEKRFGVVISDPYRWLEENIHRDQDVRKWVDAQNELTESYLAALPARDAFAARLKQLFDFERVSAPERRGDRYFFMRQSGLENQPKLVVRTEASGSQWVIVDPNEWSQDGEVSIVEWGVSRDGNHVAFATQERGSDLWTIRVVDVEADTILKDELPQVSFSTIAWAHDGSGFYYSRVPEGPDAGAATVSHTEHAIYFHTLGTPQNADRVIYPVENGASLVHTIKLTSDGRYGIVSSTPNGRSNSVSIIDLADRTHAPHTIVADTIHRWTFVGDVGSRLFFVTDKDAERGKVIAFDLSSDKLVAQDCVAESETDTLHEVALIGQIILATYLADAKSVVRRYGIDGSPDGAVDGPGIGTFSDFRGSADNPEAFFAFAGYDVPKTIYRYDVAARTLSIWAEQKVEVDLEGIGVEQHFFASLDGTRVPMFVIRRVDLDEPVPTMLFAYGGIGLPWLPNFSPEIIAWVEQGGAYVVANIRGGGEYGKAWWDAGRLDKKQNCFADFIAAGEYLKAEGIALSDGLAINGMSNGGLLIGAVVNQRPDLFEVALPDVAVLDMIRFERFANGELMIEEYGSPDNEVAFRNLLSYSPLQNIKAGQTYPAILTTTADRDERVVPGHSFKYAATLQAANIGDKPHLLRVEKDAGHYTGMPVGKLIATTAARWAFAAEWTGLVVDRYVTGRSKQVRQPGSDGSRPE